MNARKSKSRNQKIAERTLALRGELWPDLEEGDIWDRRVVKAGFTTIPRTFPLLFRIMNEVAPKGKPVSSTYMALWCRAFDEAMVTVNNEHEIAYEAGFGGQRSTYTLATRMEVLQELGFISIKPGAKGPRTYILLLNPYQVVKALRDKRKIQSQTYIALLTRAQEIGANDLE